MYASLAPSRLTGSLLAVQSPAQFEHYLRESESLTGCARRLFVIASADRLRYQVHVSADGWQIDRLDGHGQVLSTATLASEDVLAHPLIEAARCGQLYTPPAHH